MSQRDLERKCTHNERVEDENWQTILRVCKWLIELDKARAWLIRANRSLHSEIGKATPEMAEYFQAFVAAGGCTHDDWCDWRCNRFPSKRPVPAKGSLRLVANNPHQISKPQFRRYRPNPDAA